MDDTLELLRSSTDSLSSGATLRAATEAREALALARGDAALERLALEALGTALWSRGEVHHAAVVLGTAAALRERLGEVGPGPLDDLARYSPGWEQGRHLGGPQDVLLWLSSGRDSRGRPTSGWESLTASERRVVELAVEGLTNPAIGRRLFVSPNTVKTHLLRSYRKLGVSSRTELKQVRR